MPRSPQKGLRDLPGHTHTHTKNAALNAEMDQGFRPGPRRLEKRGWGLKYVASLHSEMRRQSVPRKVVLGGYLEVHGYHSYKSTYNLLGGLRGLISTVIVGVITLNPKP